MQSGVFNHTDKGRYTGAYFFNIEDVNPFFEQQGFETIQLITSKGIGGQLTEEHWAYWRERGEEGEIMELVYESAKDPYLLGTASHLLYIGRKK
ncbi:hypothetical protein [Paenibacillus sp. OV219]|uniref:hypothetical protein n=1 Tax=Paenibacillus sp. OV219 TaxID=1884377 RepID=UPI0008B7E426|nr:hypothetical protein SAMN05518847_11394 [Paenibacillus sp. OV219]